MLHLRVFVLGVLSYIPYHYLIGVLAEVPLPVFAKEMMRTYRRPAVIAVDLAMTVLPVFLLFALLAFALFRLAAKATVSTAITFCAGWAIVFLGVMMHAQPPDVADMFGRIQEWPHLLFLHFAPVGGALAGAHLAAKGRSSRI
jgi:hypothetical protein